MSRWEQIWDALCDEGGLILVMLLILCMLGVPIWLMVM